MFIKRNLSKNILRLSQAFPVVAILGPRQSGKTTLLKELFKNYKYLSLEDLSLRADAKQDPNGFLNLHKNNYGIIIDEFQHVPELLSYIHHFYIATIFCAFYEAINKNSEIIFL